jgi:glycerophosphoryl diester phosphodiesterase
MTNSNTTKNKQPQFKIINNSEPTGYPTIVGHRGFPEVYPENSLISIQAAIDIGAKAIEIDIQLSSDKVPVVFHDDTLDRITNKKGSIFNYTSEQLQSISIDKQSRFSKQFKDTKISLLKDVVKLISNYSNVTFFVELKPESIQHFGIQTCVDKLIEILEPVKQQTVIISYDEQALKFIKQQYQFKTGWILTNYDKVTRDTAKQLQVDYLVCNYTKINPYDEKLWQGNWQWMLYTIDDLSQALDWYQKGADYIETDSIANFFS